MTEHRSINARFFNHSCAANCLSVGYDFEIAVRDIQAGEELTDDYGTLNLAEPFPGSCGTAECRGILLPDDHTRIGDQWNTLARDAFVLIPAVAQPLWDILSERDEIEDALRDLSLLRPIQHHFPPATPK